VRSYATHSLTIKDGANVITDNTLVDGSILLENVPGHFTTNSINATVTAVGHISATGIHGTHYLNVTSFSVSIGGYLTIGNYVNVILATGAPLNLGGNLSFSGSGVVDASAGTFMIMSSVPLVEFLTEYGDEYTYDNGSILSENFSVSYWAVRPPWSSITGAVIDSSAGNLILPSGGIEFNFTNGLLRLVNCTITQDILIGPRTGLVGPAGVIELVGTTTLNMQTGSTLLTLMTETEYYQDRFGGWDLRRASTSPITNATIDGDLTVTNLIVRGNQHWQDKVTINGTVNVTGKTVVNGDLVIGASGNYTGNVMETWERGMGSVSTLLPSPGVFAIDLNLLNISYNSSLTMEERISVTLAAGAPVSNTGLRLNGNLMLESDSNLAFADPGPGEVRKIEVTDSRTITMTIGSTTTTTVTYPTYGPGATSGNLAALPDKPGRIDSAMDRDLHLDLLRIPEGHALALGSKMALTFGDGKNLETDGEIWLNGTLLVSNSNSDRLNHTDTYGSDTNYCYAIDLKKGVMIVDSMTARLLWLNTDGSSTRSAIWAYQMVIRDDMQMYVGPMATVEMSNADKSATDKSFISLRGTLTLEGDTYNGGRIVADLIGVPDGQTGKIMGRGEFRAGETWLGNESIFVVGFNANINTYVTDDPMMQGTMAVPLHDHDGRELRGFINPVPGQPNGNGRVDIYGGLNAQPNPRTGDRTTVDKLNLLYDPATGGKGTFNGRLQVFELIVDVGCLLELDNSTDIKVGTSAKSGVAIINGTLNLSGSNAKLDLQHATLLIEENDMSAADGQISAKLLADGQIIKVGKLIIRNGTIFDVQKANFVIMKDPVLTELDGCVYLNGELFMDDNSTMFLEHEDGYFIVAEVISMKSFVTVVGVETMYNANPHTWYIHGLEPNDIVQWGFTRNDMRVWDWEGTNANELLLTDAGDYTIWYKILRPIMDGSTIIGYYLDANGSIQITIHKAILTVTPNTLTMSPGTSLPTQSMYTSTITGWVNGQTWASEEVRINPATGLPYISGSFLYGTNATPTSGGGHYQINIIAGTAKADNYEFKFMTGTLTISTTPMTVVGITTTYSGTEHGVTFANLQDGDRLIIWWEDADGNTVYYMDAPSGFVIDGVTILLNVGDFINAGTYEVFYELYREGYSVDGDPSSPAAEGSAEVVIEKAMLTVTANNVTWTPSDRPAFSYTITGFVNGETEDDIDFWIGYGCYVNSGTNLTPFIGQFIPIFPGGPDDVDNYRLNYVEGTLTVLNSMNAGAGITVAGVNVTYDAQPHGVIALNLTPGHTITFTTGSGSSSVSSGAITVPAEGEVEWKPRTNAGEYRVNWVVRDAGNNVIADGSTWFVINKATLTIAANNILVLPGKPLPPYTFTANGFVGDVYVVDGVDHLVTTWEEFSRMVPRPFAGGLTGTTFAFTNMGTGELSISDRVAGMGEIISATNYDFVFLSGTIEISPNAVATPPVTVVGAEVMYDGNEHGVEFIGTSNADGYVSVTEEDIMSMLGTLYYLEGISYVEIKDLDEFFYRLNENLGVTNQENNIWILVGAESYMNLSRWGSPIIPAIGGGVDRYLLPFLTGLEYLVSPGTYDSVATMTDLIVTGAVYGPSGVVITPGEYGAYIYVGHDDIEVFWNGAWEMYNPAVHNFTDAGIHILKYEVTREGFPTPAEGKVEVIIRHAPLMVAANNTVISEGDPIPSFGTWHTQQTAPIGDYVTMWAFVDPSDFDKIDWSLVKMSTTATATSAPGRAYTITIVGPDGYVQIPNIFTELTTNASTTTLYRPSTLADITSGSPVLMIPSAGGSWTSYTNVVPQLLAKSGQANLYYNNTPTTYAAVSSPAHLSGDVYKLVDGVYIPINVMETLGDVFSAIPNTAAGLPHLSGDVYKLSTNVSEKLDVMYLLGGVFKRNGPGDYERVTSPSGLTLSMYKMDGNYKPVYINGSLTILTNYGGVDDLGKDVAFNGLQLASGEGVLSGRGILTLTENGIYIHYDSKLTISEETSVDSWIDGDRAGTELVLKGTLRNTMLHAVDGPDTYMLVGDRVFKLDGDVYVLVGDRATMAPAAYGALVDLLYTPVANVVTDLRDRAIAATGITGTLRVESYPGSAASASWITIPTNVTGVPYLTGDVYLVDSTGTVYEKIDVMYLLGTIFVKNDTGDYTQAFNTSELDFLSMYRQKGPESTSSVMYFTVPSGAKATLGNELQVLGAVAPRPGGAPADIQGPSATTWLTLESTGKLVLPAGDMKLNGTLNLSPGSVVDVGGKIRVTDPNNTAFIVNLDPEESNVKVYSKGIEIDRTNSARFASLYIEEGVDLLVRGNATINGELHIAGTVTVTGDTSMTISGGVIENSDAGMFKTGTLTMSPGVTGNMILHVNNFHEEGSFIVNNVFTMENRSRIYLSNSQITVMNEILINSVAGSQTPAEIINNGAGIAMVSTSRNLNIPSGNTLKVREDATLSLAASTVSSEISGLLEIHGKLITRDASTLRTGSADNPTAGTGTITFFEGSEFTVARADISALAVLGDVYKMTSPGVYVQITDSIELVASLGNPSGNVYKKIADNTFVQLTMTEMVDEVGAFRPVTNALTDRALLAGDVYRLVDGEYVKINVLDALGPLYISSDPTVMTLATMANVLSGSVYVDIPGHSVRTEVANLTGFAALRMMLGDVYIHVPATSAGLLHLATPGDVYNLNASFLGPVCHSGEHYNAVTAVSMDVKIGSTGILHGYVRANGALELFNNPINTCGFTPYGTSAAATVSQIESFFDRTSSSTWAGYNGTYSLIEEGPSATIYFGHMDIGSADEFIKRSSGAKLIFDGMYAEYIFNNKDDAYITYWLSLHNNYYNDTIKDLTAPVSDDGLFFIRVSEASDGIFFVLSYSNYYYWTGLGDREEDGYRFPSLLFALNAWEDLGPGLGYLVAVGNMTDNLSGSDIIFDPTVTLLLYYEYSGAEDMSKNLAENPMTNPTVLMNALMGLNATREPGLLMWTDTTNLGVGGIRGSVTIGNIWTSFAWDYNGAAMNPAMWTASAFTTDDMIVQRGTLTIEGINVNIGTLATPGSILGEGGMELTNVTITAGEVLLEEDAYIRVSGNVNIYGFDSAPCNVTTPSLTMAAAGKANVAVGGNLTVTAENAPSFTPSRDGVVIMAPTDIKGTLSVRGDFRAEGNIILREGDSAASLTAGSVYSGGKVTVEGDVITTSNGPFTALGDTTIKGILRAGHVIVGDTDPADLVVGDYATVQSVIVNGAINVTNNLTVTSFNNATDRIAVSADILTVGGTLIVNGVDARVTLNMDGSSGSPYVSRVGAFISTGGVTVELSDLHNFAVTGSIDSMGSVTVITDALNETGLLTVGGNINIRSLGTPMSGALATENVNVFVTLALEAMSVNVVGTLTVGLDATIGDNGTGPLTVTENTIIKGALTAGVTTIGTFDAFGEPTNRADLLVARNMEVRTTTISGKLKVDAVAVVSGDLTVFGEGLAAGEEAISVRYTLSASAFAAAAGDVYSGGDVWVGWDVRVTGDFTSLGNVDVDMNFRVGGDVVIGDPNDPLSFASLTAGAGASIGVGPVPGDDLTVTGDVKILDSDLMIRGDAVIGGHLDVSTGSVRAKNMTVTDYVYVFFNLDANSVQVGDDPAYFEVGNDANVEELTVIGNVIIGRSLTVSVGDMDVEGNVDVVRDLVVDDGNVDVTGYVNIGGGFTVITGYVDIGDDLTVVGNVEINGDLTAEVVKIGITTDLILSHLIVVNGDVDVKDLYVEDYVDIQRGSLTVRDGNAMIGDRLTVGKYVYVTGIVDVGDNMAVKGFDFRTDVTYGDIAVFAGELKVAGSLTVDNASSDVSIRLNRINGESWVNSLSSPDTATGKINLYIAQDHKFEIKGDVVMGGSLTVTGDPPGATLQVDGNMAVGKDGVGGSLVTDNVSINVGLNLIVYGIVDIDGTLQVLSDMSVYGYGRGAGEFDVITVHDMTVLGGLYINVDDPSPTNMNLTMVSGVSSVGSLTSLNGLSVILEKNHALRVLGDVTVESGDLEIWADASSDMYGYKPVVINDDVYVDGSFITYNLEEVEIFGSLTVGGYVEIGPSSLSTSLTVGRNMTVSGANNYVAITVGVMAVGGDLELKNNMPARIELLDRADSPDKVVTTVGGSLIAQRECTIDLAKNHEITIGGDVKVTHGDFVVRASADSDSPGYTPIDIGGSMDVDTGALRAYNVDEVVIVGDLYVDKYIDIGNAALVVGGNLKVAGADDEDVAIRAGTMTVDGKLTLSSEEHVIIILSSFSFAADDLAELKEKLSDLKAGNPGIGPELDDYIISLAGFADYLEAYIEYLEDFFPGSGVYVTELNALLSELNDIIADLESGLDLTAALTDLDAWFFGAESYTMDLESGGLIWSSVGAIDSFGGFTFDLWHNLEINGSLFTDGSAKFISHSSESLWLNINGNVTVGEGESFEADRINVVTVTGTVTAFGGLVEVTGGDLRVVGSVYAGTVVITDGDLIAEGSVIVSGDVTVTGGNIRVEGIVDAYDVDVEGVVEITGDMFVRGTELNAGALLMENGALYLMNSVVTVVIKNIDLDDDPVQSVVLLFNAAGDCDLTIDGSGSTYEALIVNTDFIIGSDLNMIGSLEVMRDVTIRGNINKMTGDMDVAYAITVNGDIVDMEGNMKAGTSITVEGNVILMKGDMEAVDRDINIYGSLTEMEGNMKAGYSITIDGGVDSMIGDMEAGRNIIIGTRTIAGDTYMEGNLKAGDNLSLYGALYLIGDLDVGTTFHVTGDMYMEGNANVGKDFVANGNVVLKGILDIYKENELTTLELWKSAEIGALIVNDCRMYVPYGDSTVLKLTGLAGIDSSLTVIERFMVDSGGSIHIMTGNLEMFDSTELTLRKGNLYVYDGDAVLGDKVTNLTITEGDMKLWNGSLIMGNDATMVLGGGDLIIVDGYIMTGSGSVLRVDDGNMTVSGSIHALAADPTLGADISVNGIMIVSGDVYAKSLTVRSDAMIGGDLTIGISEILLNPEEPPGLRIDGSLKMESDATIILHSRGVVERSLLANGHALVINVLNGEMLTVRMNFTAKDLTLDGMLTVSEAMTIAEDLTMLKAWVHVGPNSHVGGDIVVFSSSTLTGGPLTAGSLTTVEPGEYSGGRLDILGTVNILGETLVQKGSFLVVSSSIDEFGMPDPGMLMTKDLTVEGRLDVLRDGVLKVTNNLLVDGGLFNMDGTMDVVNMTVFGVANISGYATTTGVVTIGNGIEGEMNIGPYGPYANTRYYIEEGKLMHDSAFTMRNSASILGPQLIVSEHGYIWIYGTFDASAIPAAKVGNNGYIWAWDVGTHDGLGGSGTPRTVIPNGNGAVNYSVEVLAGQYTVGPAIIHMNALHTSPLVVTLNHEYGYAIQDVNVFLRGVQLTYGVDYTFDRHTVTVFASALDGATGLVEIEVTNAYQPTVTDLLIQVSMLGGLLLLFLLLLFLLRKRKKKKTAVVKRYY